VEPIVIILIAVGAPLLLLGIWVIVAYNRFVRLRQHIKESWSDIDVELKRRYDLIPNLVETVKGYASHEKNTLVMIVNARNKAVASHGSASDQALDESALLIGLKKLFAVVEDYPELKADTHFLALQKELSLTEDRVAASRRFYNANVREMNQLEGAFPTNIVANVFKFEHQSFFELSSDAERVVPTINI
jgi:LemA protein